MKKKQSKEKNDQIHTNFLYLSDERVNEVYDIFEQFKSAPSPYQTTQNNNPLKKFSRLEYYPVKITGTS